VSVFNRVLFLVAMFLAFRGATAARAAGRVEQLLPKETLALVSVGDLPQLIAAWDRLGFRPPRANPTLSAVVRHAEGRLPPQWRESGPDWPAWLSLSTGEACLAVVESKSASPAIVFCMEVRGRQDKAAALLDRIGRAPGNTPQPPIEQAIRETRVLQYPSLAYFIKDDLLVAASESETALAILRSWPGTGGMVAGETYRAVMRQCRADAEGDGPEFRCFVRPIQYLAALAGSEKRKPPMTPEKYLRQAKQTGFEAIRGVGGAAWFGRDGHALDYRIGVYAPDHDTTAMRMLVMPNRPTHEPPPWIPGDVAGYCSLSWEMQQAFGHFAKLFDLAMADVAGGETGVFDDVLDALAKDPNGPKLDIRAEFIRRLGNRVLVVCGPATAGRSVWDRGVFAFQVTDEAAVARALDKYCESSDSEPASGHNKHQIAGHVVHEFTKSALPDEPPLPAVPSGVPPLAPAPKGDKPTAKKGPLAPVLVTVANGYLLWGNHGDLLKRFLTPAGSSLAGDPRYRAVEEELRRTAEGPASFFSFSRRGDDFRLLARCTDPDGFFTPFFLEAQEIVARKAVARPKPPETPGEAAQSIGPGGWQAYTLPDGWRIVGFALHANP